MRPFQCHWCPYKKRRDTKDACTQKGQRRHQPEAKERGLRRNQTCRHLDPRLPVSRTVKNKFLLFKPSNLWYFSYSPRKLIYSPKNCCLSASTSLLWILFKKYKFIFYLLLAVLGLRRCTSFSLVVVNGDYSLVAVCEFLIDVASLVEHRL